jgi:hypothetical protein
MKIEKEDLLVLDEIKQTYIKYADHISGWKDMDKNELANLYLEHETKEPERSYYFSALMCRYWKNVYTFYKTSKSTRLGIEDFTSWLAESFFVAFKYRKWKDPKNKLFNDPQGPDKVINRCIYSTRMRYYQYFNMDKRKVNFMTDSIERQIESFGQMANVYNYMATYDENQEDVNCRDIIKYYLANKNIFNAIVVDLVCFSDTFREVRTVTEVKEQNNDNTEQEEYNDFVIDSNNDENTSEKEFIESDEFENDDNQENFEDNEEVIKKVTYRIDFSLRKLMSEMRELDDIYIKYFLSVYQVEESELIKTIEKIKDLDKRKQLSRIVNKILSNISTDKKVNDILCL